MCCKRNEELIRPAGVRLESQSQLFLALFILWLLVRAQHRLPSIRGIRKQRKKNARHAWHFCLRPYSVILDYVLVSQVLDNSRAFSAIIRLRLKIRLPVIIQSRQMNIRDFTDIVWSHFELSMPKIIAFAK